MEKYWKQLSYSRKGLSTCASEPIQFCGAIQSCGWLLVYDAASGKIVAASENCEQLFSRSMVDIIGGQPGDFLKHPDGRPCQLENILDHDGLVSEGLLASNSGTILWEACSRVGGLVLIDLEPGQEESVRESASCLDHLKSLVNNMDQENDDAKALAGAARKIKFISGFDRVMIYRFEANGDGIVIAEALDDGLESFEGLRYPSTDIPPQAMKIYETSKHRMIADVCSEPVPLHTKSGTARETIDLTGSDFRAVSPFHIQYLTNMGVRASFSVALRVDGRLWGLVACHHYRVPKLLSRNLRSACDLAAQIISVRFQDRAAVQTSERRHRIFTLTQSVLLSVTEGKSAADAFNEHSEHFLGVTASGGAFVRIGADVVRIGQFPADGYFEKVIEQLRTRQVTGIWSSDDVARDLGLTPEHSAAGALVVQLNVEFEDVIIWVRPEYTREVKWGGNPNGKDKAPDDLSPRASFAAWSEKIKGRSREWMAGDMDAAQTFLVAFVKGLFQKASALSQANIELARVSRVKDEFISTVSHELRTPLSVMVGWMEILREKKIKDFEINQAIEIIDRNAKLQVKLIDDLLDISRIISGKVRIDLKDGVSLREIITEVIRDLGPTAATKSIQIQPDLPVDVVTIADSERVRQVVWNLISNSIKFTDRGGWVKVGLRDLGASCEILVIDNGIGIPKEHLRTVFDRFAQADESHAKKGGLGLGLAIVKGLAELHGGYVTANSEGPGRGSTFTVSLPMGGVALHADGSSAHQVKNDSAEEGILRGRRVLVVEDNPDAGLALLLTMRKLGAYAELVDDGKKAFDRLSGDKFDLLLSDIGMPIMDGYGLMRQWRAYEAANGAVPIQTIALTAYGTAEDALKCMDAGFQCHVKKPASREDLVAAIQSLGTYGTKH